MSKKRKTEHKQQTMKDVKGNEIHVDIGLVGVLSLLADLGVKTQFSCQGNKNESAYVLAYWNSAFPLVKIIMRMYFTRKYTPQTRFFIKKFLRGHKTFRFSKFNQYHSDNTYDEVLRLKLARGNEYKVYHAFEVSYSRAMGFRICIRWPKYETRHLYCLLLETACKLHPVSHK